MMRVILTAPGFLGDEVVFTGAVREIKLQFPHLSIKIRSNRKELWLNNPHVDEVFGDGAVLPDDHEHDIDVTHHHCPPFRAARETPLHFLQQYVNNLCGALSLPLGWPVKKFGGDVHLTKEERSAEVIDSNLRYWIVVAGWKTNVPTKGWGVQRFQELVDSMRGRICFVQIGSKDEWHQPLRGVINMIGKTQSLRELFCLIHKAEGIVCPITSIMHLSAAIEPHHAAQFDLRPCIVLGGGRESPHFIQYPGHRVIHTVGMMPCCGTGGCGKSGFGKGQCEFPTPVGDHGVVPKCFAMIDPKDVVREIEFVYKPLSLPGQTGRGRAILDTLMKFFPNETKPMGAEIGVYKGDTSSQLLLGHLGLTLHMVDRWTNDPGNFSDPSWYGRPQSVFDGYMNMALKVTEFAKDRRVIDRMPSVQAAEQYDPGTFHFVFIDADHGYEACKADIKAWYPKVRRDGFLCGHDYDRPNYPREGVKRAVDEFAAENGLIVTTGRDNTWFFMPPSCQKLPEFTW